MHERPVVLRRIATPSSSATELPIPKTRREVIGVIILTAFILGSISLAVHNLLNQEALIASALWLLLVGGMLFGFCKEFGVKHVLINILGAYSRKQFVRTVAADEESNEIQFAYRFLGCWFHYLTIPFSKIERIDWHTGQGSHMAGKDMNDWQVAVWYDHGEPVKSQRKRTLRHPDQDVYLVGSPGPKERTAKLGHELVDFVCRAGARLVRHDERTFIRT